MSAVEDRARLGGAVVHVSRFHVSYLGGARGAFSTAVEGLASCGARTRHG